MVVTHATPWTENDNMSGEMDTLAFAGTESEL